LKFPAAAAEKTAN